MKNQRTYIIAAVGIIGVIIAGVIVAYFATRSNTTTPTSQHDMSKMETSNDDESATYKKYAALKGEAYDKAFLADMIVHHDGALNMAEMANGAATDQNIKNLAANINATQGREIARMNELQEKWGYQKTSGHMMTGGDMEMMEGMSMMGDELKNLTGEAFDKKFLSLMIEHHQQAIDMARPAVTNAEHQEVKDIASAIITAQTKEIEDMKTWQKQLGYTS